jgi:hypothetical protein
MEPVSALAISRLRTSIELSVMEEERLHVILDDDAIEGREREEALEELAGVFGTIALSLSSWQLATFESQH